MPSTEPKRRRRQGILAALLASVVLAGHHLPAQEARAAEHEIRRMIKDASRALQGGDGALFARFFHKKEFSDYRGFARSLIAITEQSEVASSVDVLRLSPKGEGYEVEVDWLIQMQLKTFGGALEIRRKVLRMHMIRAKKGWKISRLDARDFFRPQSRASSDP